VIVAQSPDGLLQMQRTPGPTHIDAVIIIEAVGDVGGLLDLIRDDPRATCVKRARVYVDEVIRMHVEMT